MEITVRHATHADVAAIADVIAESSRVILRAFYSVEQIEAALEGAFGVDHSLIEDHTYFVAEEDGQIVGCGGWGRRARVFGASGSGGAQAEPLDPARDAARMRAFFIRPGYERRGIGGLILTRCEDEARQAGFRAATLMATLGGIDFYRGAGYVDQEAVRHDLGRGVTIDFLRMSKALG